VEAINFLESEAFSGIVCDLDGTVIPRGDRWLLTCRDEIRFEMDRLLSIGARIAIATGRAPSRKSLDLIRTLVDHSNWSHILVGYYNGALIKSLEDDDMSANSATAGALEPIRVLLEERLAQTSNLGGRFRVDASTFQLSLRATDIDHVVFPDRLFDIANEAICASSVHAKATRSSHSVDIVAPDVSKNNVVQALEASVDYEVLRFGDMGQWPGNDCELLAVRQGLSVNRVSTNLKTCWNVLPRGVTESDGLLYYLRRLHSDGPSRIRFQGLSG
jgi:hydroxymethylpyrimidine pyrophosphatase-like HAD family hydrolase